jgi:cysteine desulfurase
LGRRTGTIAVERDGRVSPQTLEKALVKAGEVRAAAIMGVNNETGAVMDLGALRDVLRSPKGPPGPPIHFHSDLVQALGKIPLDIRGWDLDSASFSAHKLGGMRGVGLLYLRKPLEVLYSGGGQDGGIRPGTENLAGALSMAAYLEDRAAPAVLSAEYRRAVSRWKRLITALRKIERCTLIPEDREEEDPRFSPYILQVSFRGIPGEVMARLLDDAGFAISTGSACSSGKKERPVLSAMGIDRETGLLGIRISQGWTTTVEDIEALLGAIQEILGRF